jgi:hypothetical protein
MKSKSRGKRRMLLASAALTAGTLLGCFRSNETQRGGGGGGGNSLPGNPKGSFYDDSGPPALALRDAQVSDGGTVPDAKTTPDATTNSLVIPAVTVSAGATAGPTVTHRMPANPKGSWYVDGGRPLDDIR